MLKVSKHRKAASFQAIMQNPQYREAAKTVGAKALAALPGLTIAAVTPAAASWWQKRQEGKIRQQYNAELTQSYQGMLEVHPPLKERDPVKVQRMFTTLSRVNPTLAMDPNAAGAYIRRALDEDHLDTGAGTIALVDMASRFDASKARVDLASRLGPRGKAEYVEKELGGFRHLTDETVHNVLRAAHPDIANRAYGPDPVALAEAAKQKAEDERNEANRRREENEERRHKERLAVMASRGRRP